MKSKPILNWEREPVEFTKDKLLIGGQQVMMSWETPIMHKMAEILISHTSGGDILEVGFGMGISATEIQRLGVRSHTILEPHPQIYEQALIWKDKQPHADITIIKDYWQNMEDKLPQYDGIFFDTFSLTFEETDRKRFHFLQVASEKLLKPDGALTFFYLRPQLALPYQDQLFAYFQKILIERLHIASPSDCEYDRYSDDYDYTLCVLAVANTMENEKNNS